MTDPHVARLLAAFAKMPNPLTESYVEKMVADTLGDLSEKERTAAFVAAVEAYERDAAATAAGFLAAWEPAGRVQ
jgi:3-methyladenine DNA glycosylase AlkC